MEENLNKNNAAPRRRKGEGHEILSPDHKNTAFTPYLFIFSEIRGKIAERNVGGGNAGREKGHSHPDF
jgi:hypothetical protein